MTACIRCRIWLAPFVPMQSGTAEGNNSTSLCPPALLVR
jgi:hypothetical protein